MERDEDKSGKRINRLVKLWIFLAVFLIVGNLVLLYVADHRNHPYLFFLKDLIGWLTVMNPLLVGLLLWGCRRHSLACCLGRNSPEEIKRAASEKEQTSRKELCLCL